ncbi:MAG: TIGR00730 family Rossman fold protein [Candidatus Dependentiae bacterium]|nr:TIGR00730 family Rossman fold protein [Candidatus Dependentiae bacterium]
MLRRILTCFSLFFNLIRVNWQIIKGVWRISTIPQPIVSIFGGARLPKETHYLEKVHELAERFTSHAISVITGGGSGVMEAANRGAQKPMGARGKSVGIGVKNVTTEPNKFVEIYFEVDYFFARKWLLTRYSQAFVIFPGGLGTLDELSEVLTLMMTKKLQPVPIMLVGIKYWKDLMIWMEKEAVEYGLIDKKYLEQLTLTDDLELVFNTIHSTCSISHNNKNGPTHSYK